MSSEVRTTPLRRTPRPAVLAGLVLTVVLTVLVAPGAGATETSSTPAPARAAASPLAKAQASLARAVTQLGRGHSRQAAAALGALARRTDRAHAAAIGQIGKPPTDPESDEPPGPAAVLKMLAFDHKATVTLVPLLNGEKRPRVVRSLRTALAHTHLRRNRMIARVVALPPEGAGDDYADGMSDILGTFPAEIRQIDAALATFVLAPAGRTSLTRTRAQVVVANRLMSTAYGGGE